MIVTGVSREQLEAVVREVSDVLYDGNVTVNNISSLSAKRTRFTVRVRDSRGPGARRAASGRRLVAACWHVHRDVLGALFDRYPGATVYSGLSDNDGTFRRGEVVYRGADDYGQNHGDTQYRNVGSLMSPATIGELCDCYDHRDYRRGAFSPATEATG